jgi:enamine deaminase RidA (YjgF/YER057c/UK114 family)
VALFQEDPMSTVESRLAALGHTLGTPPRPAANYVPTTRAGNLLFVAGQIPSGPGGPEFIGKLGAGIDVATGQAAAARCALAILAQAKAAGVDLDRARLVKVVGFVNSAPDFTDVPKVINGASDLFVAVLGEAGRHARSAVGVATLPFGVAVEVEAIFEVA